MATTTEAQRTTGDRRRPIVHRAWMVLGSLVVGPMLAVGVYQTVVELAHEEQTLERQFDADGVSRIEVRNAAGGAVRIVGTDADTDTITVTARVSDGLRKTGHGERVEGDRLVLESSCPIFGSSFCSVRYTVETPADVDVVVRVDTGSITVTDVAGDVDLQSDTSGIELAGIGGSIRAESDSAGVVGTELRSADVDASADSGSVRLDFAEAPQAVTAESDSGDVEVVLPQGDEAYLVDLSTDSGSESMQVRTDPTSSRTVDATTDSGDVTVRYRRS